MLCTSAIARPTLRVQADIQKIETRFSYFPYRPAMQCTAIGVVLAEPIFLFINLYAMSPLQLYAGAAVTKPSQRVIFAQVEVSHSNTTESPSPVISVSTPVSHIFND